MQTRADAVAFFQTHGVSAWLRDWSIGETVLAATEPSSQRDGITAWRRMVCIAPEDGVWALYDFTMAKAPRVATGTLSDMCQLALQRLVTSVPQSTG